jgi:mono/diheme cytochrome c family protein
MTIMKGTTNNRTTTGLVGAASVVAAAVAVAAVMLAATPRTVQAFPAYAERTGQHCAVCHVNVKGGGTLTKYGTKWFTGGMKVPKSKK